jgi:hypothetical protein
MVKPQDREPWLYLRDLISTRQPMGGCKNRQISDPHKIHASVMDIENNLRTWKAVIPTSWRFNTLDTSDPTATFDGN